MLGCASWLARGTGGAVEKKVYRVTPRLPCIYTQYCSSIQLICCIYATGRPCVHESEFCVSHSSRLYICTQWMCICTSRFALPDFKICIYAAHCFAYKCWAIGAYTQKGRQIYKMDVQKAIIYKNASPKAIIYTALPHIYKTPLFSLCIYAVELESGKNRL